MGIRLRQEGIEDFEIFERGETVGGVWRANTYPGAACDVPSHLYSFSFAPGPQLVAPLRAAAGDPRVHGGDHRPLRDALAPAARHRGDRRRPSTPSPAAGRSRPTAASRASSTSWSRPAASSLARRCPHVEGIEDFKGSVFHSAEWDHSHDLDGPQRRGDRHGRLGDPVRARDREGGGAAHDLPALGAVDPPEDGPRVPRVGAPHLRALSRAGRRGPGRASSSSSRPAPTASPGPHWVLKPFRKVADAYRASELPDPELRARATPDYEIGCKRVLITSDWYATLRGRTSSS